MHALSRSLSAISRVFPALSRSIGKQPVSRAHGPGSDRGRLQPGGGPARFLRQGCRPGVPVCACRLKVRCNPRDVHSLFSSIQFHVLVYSQCQTAITTASFQNVSIVLRRSLFPTGGQPPWPAPTHPWPPLMCFLSLWICCSAHPIQVASHHPCPLWPAPLTEQVSQARPCCSVGRCSIAFFS